MSGDGRDAMKRAGGTPLIRRTRGQKWMRLKYAEMGSFAKPFNSHITTIHSEIRENCSPSTIPFWRITENNKWFLLSFSFNRFAWTAARQSASEKALSLCIQNACTQRTAVGAALQAGGTYGESGNSHKWYAYGPHLQPNPPIFYGPI